MCGAERERERRHAALPARSRAAAAAAAEPQQGPPYILVSTHKYFGRIDGETGAFSVTPCNIQL